MPIQARIFLGYVQTKELKMHLNQSPHWLEAKLLGQAHLTETQWQEREYIGAFIPSLLTCNQIKDKEQEIKTHLQSYCPKLKLDKFVAHLLSQVFIA